LQGLSLFSDFSPPNGFDVHCLNDGQMSRLGWTVLRIVCLVEYPCVSSFHIVSLLIYIFVVKQLIGIER
jgi:hypothetical protein